MNYLNLMLILNLLSPNNDSIKYVEAFNYISSSDTIVNSFIGLKSEDSNIINIWLSPERVSFDPSFFDDEIVEYEYRNVSMECKQTIKQILNQYPYSRSIDEKNNCLSYLNQKYDYDLILFFSEVNNNRVIAEIVPFHKNWPREYEKIKMPGGLLKLLFYFDGNNINKIFFVKTSW